MRLGPREHDTSGERAGVAFQRRGIIALSEARPASSFHRGITTNVQTHEVTLAEFERDVQRSDAKFELVDGTVYAFAGGTHAHELLSRRIVRFLEDAVAPPCHAHGSDMAVQRADKPTHCFPDASVSCEPITLEPEKLLAPKLLVEVISPKSLMHDHVTKKYAYQAIPSLEEYVLVDSRRIWAALYRRFADKRSWNEHVFGASDTVLLTSIDLEIAVDGLYGGLSQLLK